MDLYSWGANSYGQLCLGTKNEGIFEPSKVNLKPFPFFAHEIDDIIGGGGQTLLLLGNGTLAGCGTNSIGQMGNVESDLVEKLVPAQESFLFASVTSKWDSTLGVTLDGKAFGWGSNCYGQLGQHSTSVLGSRKPLEISIRGRGVQVACGIRHGLILTEEGIIFAGGDYKKGQLGRKFNPNTISGYHVVPGLSRVRAIACGQNHNLALTEDNKLYGWGWNKFGQLGLDPYSPATVAPVEIPLPGITLDSETRLFAGWTHSALLTSSGTIINWGRNNYGQLGRPPTESDWEPKALNIANVKELSVGSEYNLAIKDDGSLWAWGWNEHGSCGLKEPEVLLAPSRVKLECTKAVKVFAGTGQSFAIVQ